MLSAAAAAISFLSPSPKTSQSARILTIPSRKRHLANFEPRLASLERGERIDGSLRSPVGQRTEGQASIRQAGSLRKALPPVPILNSLEPVASKATERSRRTNRPLLSKGIQNFFPKPGLTLDKLDPKSSRKPRVELPQPAQIICLEMAVLKTKTG